VWSYEIEHISVIHDINSNQSINESWSTTYKIKAFFFKLFRWISLETFCYFLIEKGSHTKYIGSIFRCISLETFGNWLLDLTTHTRLSPICGCVPRLVSCKNSSTTKTGPQDIAESAIKHPKKISNHSPWFPNK